MLKFKIITDLIRGREISNIYFTHSLGGINGIPPHDISMEFDEDHMFNKTIEVTTLPSNLCYLVADVSGIHISHMFRADSIAWLAKSFVESMPSKETPIILFASYITNGSVSLVATDKFAASIPSVNSPIGPIKNNKILAEDLLLYHRLICTINNGKYPSAGYTYVDHDGGLQPWYPFGGIKGHKKRLMDEGVPFVDDYKADVNYMQQASMWRLQY